MAREPTKLEALNRDHNWRQGSLRRLMANVCMITDYDDCIAARVLVQKEIDRTRDKFEAAKQELINDNRSKNHR